MIIVFTQEAEHDLEQIGDCIARDSPIDALHLVDALTARCAGLAEMPNRFPLVPRYEQFGIRRAVHGNYLIFYRVGQTHVEILHILHGAQDYEAVLFPET